MHIRKITRRCGAKHILKLQVSKKGTRLWGEAHLQVQMRKKPDIVAALFDVPISKVRTPL